MALQLPTSMAALQGPALGSRIGNLSARGFPVSAVDDEQAAHRQRLFNRIAPMYDNLNDVLSLGQHRIWKRMAVGWSGAKAGDSVLDICCGSGDLAMLLAEKVGPRGKVTGLDFAEEQLALARERQKKSYGRRNIEWCLGDALNLPFNVGQFDAVTVGYGLRNVRDVPRAFEEILRVLRPGALASILDFNKSTDPVTSSLQGWMLDNVVVPVASQFGFREDYEYLKESIENFHTGQELEKIAAQAGFSKAVHYEIAGGLMGVLVVSKKR
ncbi:2-phytyl-1,4-beta-naphthoquinone methyltransferase, chloroplastic [Selaginella moellendorffii]|uniref:2-phytyl-1,4-beta-naphthoquinone methyltransferase, chloroplastic n=1 Tax=Selaginella moellendorffii TaxID=88036 RepID=UPI000D1C8572|nr:2-phytyl-1,4-beta-naphthoquinone methyltransferase, chloroplastic [Selaginella moellendorffii]|eukprot:XP_024532237.1 2-phytyl-1,4-beta-naphthoquinone methyltransferase, chloroplastic [Selaginella moellendorffii]